jgi:hypothetical protein
MSVDISITLHRKPTDKRWMANVDAARALEAAGLDMPPQLVEYFGTEDYSEIEQKLQVGDHVDVVEPHIYSGVLPKGISYTVHKSYGHYFDIDVGELPESVGVVRVSVGC